jgi:hypothetical protein
VEVVLFLAIANGIYTLLGNRRDFRELEVGIYRLVQEVARKMLEIALWRMDDRLLAELDRGRLAVVHTKARKVLTAFGEIEIKRRYYRGRETGTGNFLLYLLDEPLGLEPRQRLSPWLRELAGKLAVEMPCHPAAGVLGELVPGVSAMGIWQVVQRPGDAERRAAEAAQATVFERGQTPVTGEVAQFRKGLQDRELSYVVGVDLAPASGWRRCGWRFLRTRAGAGRADMHPHPSPSLERP